MPNNILLFFAEQNNHIPCYYAQDVYQKNQLGTILDKRLIPEVNISARKQASTELGGLRWGGGVLSPAEGILGGRAP